MTEDTIQALADNTNEYSFHKNGAFIITNTKEIEQMIGMYMKMGLVHMAGVGMYWEADTRYSPVSDVMSWNRFQSLLTIHFVNNLNMSEMEQNSDKLWKLRPWPDAFREKCLQVVPEEHNSVDEMMIPFRGKISSVRQYMRGKPNPWGFKLWVRTGISGILCDFDVYQGSVNRMQARSELGLGPQPVLKIQHWDKTTKKIERPYIMAADNKFMGGVDMLDSFAAKYKLPLKSCHWNINIVWHTIVLAVVNAWFLYKRDCKAMNIPKKESSFNLMINSSSFHSDKSLNENL